MLFVADDFGYFEVEAWLDDVDLVDCLKASDCRDFAADCALDFECVDVPVRLEQFQYLQHKVGDVSYVDLIASDAQRILHLGQHVCEWVVEYHCSFTFVCYFVIRFLIR